MFGIRIKAVKLCENESEVGTMTWISQTFPYWSGRLFHADRGLTDSGGTIRPCLTSGKQTMPLTGFLLSGWVSITRLSLFESDEPATAGGGHPHQGESGCYREAAALPSSLVHGWRAGIDLEHTHCSPPHPPPLLLPTSQPMEALTHAVYCEMEDPAFPLPYILYTTERILAKLEGWWWLQCLYVCFHKAGGCTLATCSQSNARD